MSAVLTQVIIMMLLILVGILCSKLNIITESVSRGLSNLVLNIVNPVVILVSYQKPFNTHLLAGLSWALVLSLISYAVALFLPVALVRGGHDQAALAVERFSCTYSNCAFMGIPLVQGVVGEEGVLYVTAFLTLFNLLVWTHGLMQIKGEACNLKDTLQSLCSPAIFATVIGLALFLLNISLPKILLTTLSDISDLNTPLAMFTAGAVIARTQLGSALKKGRVYYITAIKLLIIPMVCLVLFKLIPVSPMVAEVVLLVTACPTAATGTLFAVEYDKDEGYASELFAVTTIFSVVTLPLVMLLWGV
ncbi:MAG: AEC family transporter [Ruminococcaceae bacterium]|nr:AEC family transporter [Oscillospiraceae bacterium]